MYKNLIIGMGEVGTALYRVLSQRDQVMCRDIQPADFSEVEVMHICIPYSPRFTSIVEEYIEQYDPQLIIVYTSTPVGTCEAIADDIVHSPVEGVHPNLDDSFRLFSRWLGSYDEGALQSASKFWYRFVREVITCKSSRYTEFLKLRSTSKYGVNLVWTDYEKKVADEIGMNFDMIKEYDAGYNKLYRDLGLFKYQRYILDPPEGVIGGHCVTENAALLDNQYPTPFLKAIKKMKGPSK